jgi:hypothetical protein
VVGGKEMIYLVLLLYFTGLFVFTCFLYELEGGGIPCFVLGIFWPVVGVFSVVYATLEVFRNNA